MNLTVSERNIGIDQALRRELMGIYGLRKCNNFNKVHNIKKSMIQTVGVLTRTRIITVFSEVHTVI